MPGPYLFVGGPMHGQWIGLREEPPSVHLVLVPRIAQADLEAWQTEQTVPRLDIDRYGLRHATIAGHRERYYLLEGFDASPFEIAAYLLIGPPLFRRPQN